MTNGTSNIGDLKKFLEALSDSDNGGNRRAVRLLIIGDLLLIDILLEARFIVQELKINGGKLDAILAAIEDD